MFPFFPMLKIKAYASGSMVVYATYGYCWSNKCNQFPIKVYYDLDEHGDICYAFAGSDFIF